ncbi:hypothetical protein SeLEV6574_g04534 [Synchytrium endobioticum]|nr:hypothetical protein SeLEV6574_g04534 [Synchytrium endobioticum]
MSDSEENIYEASDSDDFEVSKKKKGPTKPKVAASTAIKGSTKLVKEKAAVNSNAKPPTKPKKTTAAAKKTNVVASTGDSMDEDEDEAPHTGSSSKATFRKSGYSEDKTIEEIYQKKTQLEHILLRPDTYIGSVENHTQQMWVYEQGKMVHRNVTFVPGLYKIFDEILVNAADNKTRDASMDVIKVTIDREHNRIAVYNTGRGIPIEIHKEEKVYVPELIFGHLLTGSNYDDNEKKLVGGRNGYGAKLCNIFSTEFIIETASSASGKKYKQVFTNNMSKKSEPAITPNPKEEDYTKITFSPDLAKFSLTEIDDDLEALLTRRVYDLAGVVKDVKVYLNDKKILIKGFKQYIDMFAHSEDVLEGATNKPIIFESPNERWEIGVTVSEGQFQQISFVNSIATSKGGTHITHVVDQLVAALQEAVKKKDKKAQPLKPFQIKNHLSVFVNCQIENPTFDSQTKENMTLRASAFGSKCTLSEDFIKKVLKSGVVESIMSFAKAKQDQLLKKTDGHKHSRISGFTKLDDANNAGTRLASQCTLILTEGDSAKALAVSGLSIVGRDNYGVFPLRGKLLNVREATHAQIMGNQEITAIKQIMGLQQGKAYTTTDTLRYGHLMIMTDQDHDGSHIKGLIINFLDHFWPSLLKIPQFLVEFITPIVKVTKGKEKNRREITFFTIPEYEQWREQNDEGKGWTIKYYKGLGTSTSEDAKKYFGNMDRHLKPFRAAANEDRDLVDMAFNKKKADNRKDWLRHFQPGTYMDHSMNEIPISDFINKELILFSMADNARSIPSVVDGLKPGHRKILFACFKRNLKNDIKVAQLAGYVAEHSAYHHGEQSLCATIVGLAQNFVGSNNLNMLVPEGQFGTRLQGGKDAASPRYIFTMLAPLARAVFHPQDDALLNYLQDDGQKIEPEWYMPILPMVLVNGADGIGTGWSTAIPNYNPRDIVLNLMRLINGEALDKMHPWYRGFTGGIEVQDKGKYKISGIIRQTSETTVEITELPVKTWTQTYKEQLEEWLVGTEKTPAWIKDYKEYHTDSKVHFEVTLAPEILAAAVTEGLEKKFKLTSSTSTSNMVCFDAEGRIRKYESAEEVLQDFYPRRLQYYAKRKDFVLGQLTEEWKRLDNRVRFVKEIISGLLVVQNRKKADIVADLRARKYDPVFKKKDEADGQDDQHDVNDNDHGYDYLLSMPIYSLTVEKIAQLEREKTEKRRELELLEAKSATDLWRTDLDAFLAQWEAFEAQMDEAESQQPATGKKSSKLPLTKKSKPKKNVAESEDEDVDDIINDGYGDFATVKKPSLKKPSEVTKVKPVIAPAAEASKLKPRREVKKKPLPAHNEMEVYLTNSPEDIKSELGLSTAETSPRLKGDHTASSSVSLSQSRVKPLSKSPAKPPESRNVQQGTSPSKSPVGTKKTATAKPPTSSITTTTTATKRDNATKSRKVVVTDSDDSDISAKNKLVKKSINRVPVGKKAPAKKPVIRAEDDDEDDNLGVPTTSLIKTARPARVRAAATMKAVYVGSDEDDDMSDSDNDGDGDFRIEVVDDDER